MKVLWVVNTIFPDAAKRLGLEPPVYGGWMYGLSSDLAGSADLELAVATVYNGQELLSFMVNRIRYYLLPKSRKQRLSQDWRKVVAEFRPDLVHIHGTEYSHGIALMEDFTKLKYVVSIQGLVSVYHRYYLAGMSTWDVLRNITFRDIIRGDTLFQARRKFYLRGQVEKQYLSRATAVIGRTDWDRAHTQSINSQVPYYACNESLRDNFYTSEKWSLQKCIRHSIFLSQAGYPIKGLHQVLKAVALLKPQYPDILVEVAGNDITKVKTLKDRLKLGGYGRYIGSMIRKHELEKHVKFLGPLSEDRMKQAYLRSHLFICSSSIENSSNSLGEAQILGVPCITAYCGGIPSMVKDGKSAVLYRFEEYEMLGSNIKKIFEHDDFANKYSNYGSAEANLRHDRKNNLNVLLKIYDDVNKHNFEKRTSPDSPNLGGCWFDGV